MKRLSLLLFVAAFLMLSSCAKTSPYALIETDMGTIKIKLYESVPGHTNNFIKLAKEGFYDDLLFHRVMNGFMIQGGDPQSKGAAPGARLGNGGPGYTVPAEIGNYHFRGSLAGARLPDSANPQKASSGSQFYIVHGSPVTDAMLDRVEKRQGIKYTPAERDLYKQLGGYPDPLDNDYTVYGEVISGMETVDKIALVPTDGSNRPFEDVKMTVRIIYE